MKKVDKTSLAPSDAEAVEELETLAGKPFYQQRHVNYRNQEYRLSYNPYIRLTVSRNRVTKIGLLKAKLDYLPESIGNFTELRELDLEYVSLDALPESIGRLTKLRKLNLNSEHLTSLPDSFGNLTALRDLDLRQNRFETVPEPIAKLKHLKDS